MIPALLLVGALPFLKNAYRHYAPAARYAEARGRMAFLLTAARSYAEEHESDNDPATADWPTDCGAAHFLDDCAETEHFTYAVSGEPHELLTITAFGKPGGAHPGVRLELSLRRPWDEPVFRVAAAP